MVRISRVQVSSRRKLLSRASRASGLRLPADSFTTARLMARVGRIEATRFRTGPGTIVGQAQVVDGHSEKFSPRVPVVPNRSVVDRNEAKSVQPIDQHRLRHDIKKDLATAC